MMQRFDYHSPDGVDIPSVTASEMKEIDRIAAETFRLDIMQMMENAGRNLAQFVLQNLGIRKAVTILAGSGGNGGGGICAARHLRNHGLQVTLSSPRKDLSEAASKQLYILTQSGFEPVEDNLLERALELSEIVIDALIGYGLSGKPTGRVANLIQLANQSDKEILSLDVPSGMDATTGERNGVAIDPAITMTLALPKTGLTSAKGEIYLADIGIPAEVYRAVGIEVPVIFDGDYWVPLVRSDQVQSFV